LQNGIRVNCLSPSHLVSTPQKILEFDCATVDPTTLFKFTQDFEYTITSHAEIRGFLGWFTTDFPNGVVLDTKPGETYNHWGQQLFPLKESLNVAPGDKVVGKITVSRDPYEPRFNIIELQYQVGTGSQHTALFNLGHVQHLDEDSKNVFS
jgi:protein arginine N-methyltransferase 1